MHVLPAGILGNMGKSRHVCNECGSTRPWVKSVWSHIKPGGNVLIKRSYTQKVGGRMLRNIIYAQLNQFSVPGTLDTS